MKSVSAGENCERTSRSPHGERGLKSEYDEDYHNKEGRSPHGERGLKYRYLEPFRVAHMSLPAWGAWIEIIIDLKSNILMCVAPRMGSVD